MEADKPVDFNIHLFPRLEKAGHFIARLFSQLQYEGHSDHFQHPLDPPVEPVTTWPVSRWDDCGNYYEG